MKSHLLVVEDHGDTCRMIEKLLDAYGYQVDFAPDGAKALELLALTAYNGVVLDILLPVLDGMNVIRHIRTWPSPVPIIVLTAHQHLALEAIREGAQSYLMKPFASQHLRELTARWFHSPDVTL